MSRRQKFGVHCCALDSECRHNIGWCWRLEVNTPWWHLGIALTRKNRYIRLRDPKAAEPLAKSNLIPEWTTFRRW